MQKNQLDADTNDYLKQEECTLKNNGVINTQYQFHGSLAASMTFLKGSKKNQVFLETDFIRHALLTDIGFIPSLY